MKSNRRVLFGVVLCCTIAVVGIIVALYFVRFKFFSNDVKVRNIAVSASGITYYITESNELYVEGRARDSFGLYQSGFRWEYMYGLFAADKPVLFARDVERVFEGYQGFLYTDTGRNLFYFGNGSAGEPYLIASNVIHASLGRGNVVYVCENGAVYETVLSSGRPTEYYQIADNGTEAYTDSVNICILNSSGEFYKIARSGFAPNSRPQENTVKLASNIKSIQNVAEGELVLTQSQTLAYYGIHVRISSDWQNPIDLTDGDVVLENVRYCDYNPFTGVVSITEDGSLLLMQAEGKYEPIVLEKFDTIENIIDLAVGNDWIYIVFSDGSYQRIHCKTGDG